VIPARLKIEAVLDTLDHRFGDCNLSYTMGARTLGIDNDPGFVVDEINLAARFHFSHHGFARDLDRGTRIRNSLARLLFPYPSLLLHDLPIRGTLGRFPALFGNSH
jgi:hypothetical protein